jgi:hypothetical protein
MLYNDAFLNYGTQNKINLNSNQEGLENQPKQKLLEEDFHNGDFSYDLNMELEQKLRTVILICMNAL